MARSARPISSAPIKAPPGTERFYDAVRSLMGVFKVVSDEGKAVPLPHSPAMSEIGDSCLACALRIEKSLDLDGAPR